MSKERKILGKWVIYGFSFKRFALGVRIDKYGIGFDFVWVWVCVEL